MVTFAAKGAKCVAKVSAVRELVFETGAAEESSGRSSIWTRDARELGSMDLVCVPPLVGRMRKENIGRGRGRRNSVYKSKRSSGSRKREGESEDRVVRRARRRRRRCRDSMPPWEASGDVAVDIVGG